ncbi:hypothetical protein ACFX1R_006631 [Malus domestica]
MVMHPSVRWRSNTTNTQCPSSLFLSSHRLVALVAGSIRLVIMPTNHQIGSILVIRYSFIRKIDLPLPPTLLCHGACRINRHHSDAAVVKFRELEFVILKLLIVLLTES